MSCSFVSRSSQDSAASTADCSVDAVLSNSSITAASSSGSSDAVSIAVVTSEIISVTELLSDASKEFIWRKDETASKKASPASLTAPSPSTVHRVSAIVPSTSAQISMTSRGYGPRCVSSVSSSSFN